MQQFSSVALREMLLFDVVGWSKKSSSSTLASELRGCVKVEMDVLGFPGVSNSPYVPDLWT